MHAFEEGNKKVVESSCPTFQIQQFSITNLSSIQGIIVL